jgi:hypothetical protein
MNEAERRVLRERIDKARRERVSRDRMGRRTLNAAEPRGARRGKPRIETYRFPAKREALAAEYRYHGSVFD